MVNFLLQAKHYFSKPIIIFADGVRYYFDPRVKATGGGGGGGVNMTLRQYGPSISF